MVDYSLKPSPVQIYLSKKEREILDKYCEQEHRTMSDVLREYIRSLKIKT